jgi:hypothetical protein
MRLLTKTREARAATIKFIAVAVILAIGGNLLASYIWDTWNRDVSLWAGLGAAVLVVAFVTMSEIRQLEEFVDIRGFVVVHKGDVLDVPYYELSEDMARVFRAILSENEAIRSQWTKSSLRSWLPNLPPSDENAERLLHEVMEYVFLGKLSSHLSGSSLLDDKQVHSFHRADLHMLLNDNRVLDQLSRPIEDRSVLANARDSVDDRVYSEIRMMTEGDDEGTVVHASDGTHDYTRLSLKLPKGAKVQRIQQGVIRIESKEVRIELHAHFGGMAAYLDPLFVENYMGLPMGNFLRGGSKLWSVDLGISTQIKVRGLLSRRSWKLYRWSETFVDACRTAFGREEFFSAIQWPQARTMLIAQEHRAKTNVGEAGRAG